MTAEADPLLRQQGINDGPIGQRIAALERLPGQLFANDDSGRQELLGFGQSLLDELPPQGTGHRGIGPQLLGLLQIVPASGGFTLGYPRPAAIGDALYLATASRWRARSCRP